MSKFFSLATANRVLFTQALAMFVCMISIHQPLSAELVVFVLLFSFASAVSVDKFNGYKNMAKRITIGQIFQQICSSLFLSLFLSQFGLVQSYVE